MGGNVWIVVQHRDGNLHRMSREAVAAGRALAESVGGKAEAILLGSDLGELVESVRALGIDAVRLANHPALAAYTPGAYVSVLAPAIRSAQPAFVVFPHTYQTVDYMARLAQASGAGLLPEITAIVSGADGLAFKRPILGGKLESLVRVKGEGAMLVSVQSGAFPAGAPSAQSAPVQDLEAGSAAPDREILGVEAVGLDKVDLTKAEIIVAAGRGVGGADKMGALEELARELGAEMAASRPVIDNGWLPRDRQIGSSGQTVAPKLYVAAGISGAIQHTVGMKGSQVVVAINKDPGAPIFNLATYGLVGDIHEIVPAITLALRAAKAG